VPRVTGETLRTGR